MTHQSQSGTKPSSKPRDPETGVARVALEPNLHFRFRSITEELKSSPNAIHDSDRDVMLLSTNLGILQLIYYPGKDKLTVLTTADKDNPKLFSVHLTTITRSGYTTPQTVNKHLEAIEASFGK